jgi:hypothetical protein
MRSYGHLQKFVSLAFAVLLLLAGCGPSGSTGNRRASSGGDSATSPDGGIEQLIGEYMPPLEGGKLEVAPPKGWSFSRAGNEYLVGFHPSSSSLSDLPRILVSVEASPFAGVDELQAANAKQVVQAVQATLAGDQLKSPAAAVTLGGRTWIEHVGLGKSRNALVARQVLQTVVGGRLYKIRLEVFDRHFDNQRKNGYAVAASAKFNASPSPLDGDLEPAVPAAELPPDTDSEN